MDSINQSELSESEKKERENLRIIELQNLIEKNIKIERQVESRSFSESVLDIRDIISKANEVTEGFQERPGSSTELVLDTELLKRNHEVICKAIQSNTNISDRMLCTAITNLVFKDDVEHWDALCSHACPCAVPFFTNSTMLPFIDVEPKQKIPKQRAARKTTLNAVEKRPKLSDKLERKGEGSTAVNHVLKQIRNIYRAGNNEPIPYFKLICNPNNFMDSVQNALMISFLVKENLIVLENGAEGLPQVRVNSSSDETSANQSVQAICSLTVNLCQKYVKHYKLKEPMLKRLDRDEN